MYRKREPKRTFSSTTFNNDAFQKYFRKTKQGSLQDEISANSTGIDSQVISVCGPKQTTTRTCQTTAHHCNWPGVLCPRHVRVQIYYWRFVSKIFGQLIIISFIPTTSIRKIILKPRDKWQNRAPTSSACHWPCSIYPPEATVTRNLCVHCQRAPLHQSQVRFCGLRWLLVGKSNRAKVFKCDFPLTCSPGPEVSHVTPHTMTNCATKLATPSAMRTPCTRSCGHVRRPARRRIIRCTTHGSVKMYANPQIAPENLKWTWKVDSTFLA